MTKINIDTMHMVDKQECQPVIMVRDNHWAATDLQLSCIRVCQPELRSEQTRLVSVWIKRSILCRLEVFLVGSDDDEKRVLSVKLFSSSKQR